MQIFTHEDSKYIIVREIYYKLGETNTELIRKKYSEKHVIFIPNNEEGKILITNKMIEAEYKDIQHETKDKLVVA